ncbi:acyl-CoA carboxylase subunit epsilon [Leekyejoonella antrihumi]|uniref:Acyl-CoA carboxylase subunit epsilon n=1 Tax=Leekyejoonella antrihumi TaxID=1660198 RepID=A0A563DQ42_9MICO|nr:acyl-CoA carboxylase subunit epsilon [Leekyejoonella antrihumi]TWP32330.1 acyl-CoA carboxylase subunit epsilon [Leekyejoonella antrihumi]
MSDQSPPPVLRVVRGDATPEEIAVLVAVLSAAAGGPDSSAPPRSTWSGRNRASWRGSGLPH